MTPYPLHHGRLLLACLLVGCAGADYEAAPQAPPPPPAAPVEEPAQAPEPYTEATTTAPAPPQEAAPPPPQQPAPGPAPLAAPPTGPTAPAPAQLVYSYPTGQWVYLAGRGWVWVPAGATTQELEGAPYAYLYTPAYGWTWYLSPWGWGPYHYGIWARHPWHPVGWHGYWVAHPHAAVRLGRGHFRR
jgi:hypothetical protein